jgi:hypothetical protein
MNVTTYHYDINRTGWNQNETVLTPQNVADVRVLFAYDSDALDDLINAQPLYMQDAVIKGRTVNAVFVATRSGTVYAFDADNFRPKSPLHDQWLWKTPLVGPEEQPPDGALRATPVIDTSPINATLQAIIYVVVKAQGKDPQGIYFRIHGLNVADGSNVIGPTKIDEGSVAKVSGDGDPQSSPGEVYFDPGMHFNRPALLLANDLIYVAFGSTGDKPPYHGWMISFQRDLRLAATFCTTPDSTDDDSEDIDTPTLGGAIWQAGFGPAADQDGFIYCITGNGLNTVFPDPRKGSPLDGYETSFNSQQHVNYIGDDGHVHELVFDNRWGHTDLTVAAGAIDALPRRDSPLDGYETFSLLSSKTHNEQQHVNYIAYNHHVYELVYTDHWDNIDLSDKAGTTDPESLPIPGSPIDGYQTIFNNQQHVNYIGRNHHVYELVFKDPQWSLIDLSKEAGVTDPKFLPIPGSPIDGYETSYNSQQHVNYIGRDEHGNLHVYELACKDNQWGYTDLSSQAGANAPIPESALDGYETTSNNQQHVNYIGFDDSQKNLHVHELVFKDGQWSHADLMTEAAKTVGNGILEFWNLPMTRSPLDGYETTSNGQQHVNYIGNDGHVHELVFKDNKWGHNDLSNAAGAAFSDLQPRLDSPLDGYETSNGQQHVNYIGNDGHVHELVFKDNQWGHTDLNLAANQNRNYGDSMLQLNGGLRLDGSFIPPDPLSLTLHDTDFGSGGAMVLPDGVGGGKFVVGCGKDGQVYLVDRSKMGLHFHEIGEFKSTLPLASYSDPSDTSQDGAGIGVWGGPAYYRDPQGDFIYYCADAGPLQAIAVANGGITPTSNKTPSDADPNKHVQRFRGEGGTIPIVTSNGSVPGTALVWCITRPDKDDQSIYLRAYDAADLNRGYLFEWPIGQWNHGDWNRKQSGELPGPGAFLAPVVVNGKAYVAADRVLVVYGLPE